MCQHILVNLHDVELNEKMLLILGMYGSLTNKDGFGIASVSTTLKSEYPMYLDLTVGKDIKGLKSAKSNPLMGHVRNASPNVPVCLENTHPFLENNIVFQHNGKLSPKNPKEFVLDYETEVLDEKTGKSEKKTYKYSDSMLFFKEFLKVYKDEEHFIDSLKETMDKFYGKFAFMFNIGNTHYVIRGKTADLYISYLMDEDGKKALGYVVCTSFANLDVGSILLSNLNQLEGKPRLNFSVPTALEEETVYKAGKFGLIKIGKLEENSEVYSSNYADWGPSSKTTNFIGKGATQIKKVVVGGDKLIVDLYEFQRKFSLSVKDLSDIFMVGYGVSLKELEPEIVKHFLDKVVPLFGQKVKKEIRKELLKLKNGYPVSRGEYMNQGVQFPWMVWDEESQKKLLT